MASVVAICPAVTLLASSAHSTYTILNSPLSWSCHLSRSCCIIACYLPYHCKDFPNSCHVFSKHLTCVSCQMPCNIPCQVLPPWCACSPLLGFPQRQGVTPLYLQVLGFYSLATLAGFFTIAKCWTMSSPLVPLSPFIHVWVADVCQVPS